MKYWIPENLARVRGFIGTSLCAIALITSSTGFAKASVVDFTFASSSWSYGTNGGVSSTLAGVVGYGFSFGGVDVGVYGGFKTAGGEAPAIYSTVPTTFGPASIANMDGNAAEFANGGSSYYADISGGFLGVKSSAGNFGYVEFDWNSAGGVFTVLSAKYETVVGQAISVSAVPLPAAFPLLLFALGGLGFAARRRKAA